MPDLQPVYEAVLVGVKEFNLATLILPLLRKVDLKRSSSPEQHYLSYYYY
jgi:hypothetical protein